MKGANVVIYYQFPSWKLGFFLLTFILFVKAMAVEGGNSKD
jgi:hypothetical protein